MCYERASHALTVKFFWGNPIPTGRFPGAKKFLLPPLKTLLRPQVSKFLPGARHRRQICSPPSIFLPEVTESKKLRFANLPSMPRNNGTNIPKCFIFKEGSVFVKVFVVKIVTDTPCCGGKAKIGAHMLRQKVTHSKKQICSPPPPVGML